MNVFQDMNLTLMNGASVDFAADCADCIGDLNVKQGDVEVKGV